VSTPATFRDAATYDKPLQWATGAKLVLVNGQVAIENEKPTDKTRWPRHSPSGETVGQAGQLAQCDKQAACRYEDRRSSHSSIVRGQSIF